LPETLPLIATVALSAGAMKLAKMGVVVRNLSAIRDFGSMTVLCSDKTGTLTENQLKASERLICDEAAFADVLAVAHGIHGQIVDPFQEALRGLDAPHTLGAVSLLHAIPFDAARRSASFIVKLTPDAAQHNGDAQNRAHFQKLLPRALTVTQGAYEVMTGDLPDESRRAEILKWITDREAKGQRILAFAVAEGSRTRIAAVISFVDPVRQSAWKALDHARKLGVTVKIISGDSELVSASVARQLRLIERDDQVINGFEWAKLSQEEKRERIKIITVFGRFLPIQKYEVIKLLQDAGEVVGYIGDGVNDAPSLKLADVGISVSNGTDIAKNSSDIILLQRGLGVIVGGVHEGRAVFENVSKYLRLTLTENLGNFLSISALSLFIPYLPMLPIQILVTNLITDFPHLAIATDSIDPKAVGRPKRLQFKSLLRFMLFLSFISSAADLTYFHFFKQMPAGTVQTGWFMFSTLAEIATIYSVRSRGFFFQSSRPSNFLVLASSAVVVTIFTAVYFPPLAALLKLTPLPLHMTATILGIVLCYLHPRKGCSRGVRVKEIRRDELPAVLAFLKTAADRNAERFAKAIAATSTP
jgi:Mg2+-importing ATPase